MDRSPTDSADRLCSDRPAARREAAEEVAAVADEDPGRLAAVTDALVTALTDDDDRVRIGVSYALYHLAGVDPSAIRPHVGGVIEGLDDHRRTVRKNLARPVAVVAAAWPDDVAVAVENLGRLLSDEDPHVRRSAARALESVAAADPSAVRSRAWTLLDGVGDDHPPVVAHCCLALAHLVRFDDGYVPPDLGRVVDLATAGPADVRQGACVLLGAVGTDVAVSGLLEARDSPEGRREQGAHPSEESDPEAAGSAGSESVEATARSGLREASFPHGADGRIGHGIEQVAVETAMDFGASGAASPIDVGDWLSVDAAEFTPRTGRFRGCVRVLVTPGRVSREDSGGEDGNGTEPADSAGDDGDVPGDTDGTPGGPVIRCHNPYERYWLDCWRRGDRLVGAYQDRHNTGVRHFEATRPRRLPDDVVPLLYARVGDELRFRIEGAPHGIVVDRTAGVDDNCSVYGHDEARGYEIELRACGHHPTRAEFRRGRGFRASDVELAGIGHTARSPPCAEPWAEDGADRV